MEMTRRPSGYTSLIFDFHAHVIVQLATGALERLRCHIITTSRIYITAKEAT
jgi:hypothetical protein